MEFDNALWKDLSTMLLMTFWHGTLFAYCFMLPLIVVGDTMECVLFSNSMTLISKLLVDKDLAISKIISSVSWQNKCNHYKYTMIRETFVAYSFIMVTRNIPSIRRQWLELGLGLVLDISQWKLTRLCWKDLTYSIACYLHAHCCMLSITVVGDKLEYVMFIIYMTFISK